MTTTLDTIETRLSENMGDYLSVATTTNITTNTSIISTNLLSYDNGMNDFFNNWWVWITTGNNIGVERQIADYATATGTLTVRGSNLGAEAGAVTIRVYRYSRANKIRAINNAIRSIYPTLYRVIDDHNLITDNILPNAHFEDWAVTTAPDFYTMQDANITATALTTAGLIRGGGKSMNAVTGAAGAGKYVYITSKTYPRLLDLMNKTITFKCWAYPQVANDASIEIYTIKANGTTIQTLTSTTTCPVTAWTLLELEDQVINDDIVEIQFRFKITSASKYVYFDAARVNGISLYEYLLPTAFQAGDVERVYIQSSGYSDDVCDDLHPTTWDAVWGWEYVRSDYKYLKLPYSYTGNRQIRLQGIAPLETLSSATDTISLDSPKNDLLIARAKIDLFQLLKNAPASQDIGRYNDALADAWREYKNLEPRHSMGQRAIYPKLPVY